MKWPSRTDFGLAQIYSSESESQLSFARSPIQVKNKLPALPDSDSGESVSPSEQPPAEGPVTL